MNPLAFKLQSYGLTDVGLTRKNNEDVLHILKEQGFFALADGMGGHKAGEVAAEEAVRFMCASVEELFISSEKSWNIFELSSFSRLCFENVNSWIHHLGKKKSAHNGMGTTLCTLLFHEHSLIYGHVGDSRIYRLRDGELKQLTEDHSLRNQMIAQGKIKVNNKGTFPYKNVLTRAIGTHVEVEPEIHIAPVTPNDLYLMCSDGLSDQVSDLEIKNILSTSPDLETASATLVERANEMGGLDNVTVLLVKAEENEPDHIS